MALAGFNRARRQLAKGEPVTDLDRFQHTSGKIEYAAPGTKRHNIFLRSAVWQKVPLSTDSEPVEDPVVVVEATPEPEMNLGDLTVAELRALAADRGITVPGKARKGHIIELLGG